MAEQLAVEVDVKNVTQQQQQQQQQYTAGQAHLFCLDVWIKIKMKTNIMYLNIYLQ